MVDVVAPPLGVQNHARWRMQRFLGAHILIFMAQACGPVDSMGTASGDRARVQSAGAAAISGAIVAEIVRSQGVPVDQARHWVADDARLAVAAVARRIVPADQEPWGAVASLARANLGSIWLRARAEGDLKPSETEQLRVIHAVVRRAGGQSGRRPQEIASELRASVLGSKTPEDFEAAAGRFAREYPSLRVERLPLFDATGATEGGTGMLDAEFVAGAYGLEQPGETSEVVETRFGWHVIRLVERVQPSRALPPPPALYDAVLEMRARQSLAAVLLRQRARTRVEIAVGAEASMAEAVVGIL